MNDSFEFILGMYSIIAGLGVSRLLEGIRNAVSIGMLRKVYWVHGLVVLLGIAVHATTWLSLWSLRRVEAWTVGGFLWVMLVPSLMYLFSTMVIRTEVDIEREESTKVYYFDHARKVHGLLAAAVLVNIFSEYVVLGHFGQPQLLANRLVFISLLAACAIWSRAERLHRVIVPLVFLAGCIIPASLDVQVTE